MLHPPPEEVSGARRRNTAELMMLVTIAIWAGNYPLSKYGLTGLPPNVFNGIRFLVASLFLSLLFLRNVRWRPMPVADRNGLLAVGFLGNVVYQAGFMIALSLTTAGNTSVLVSTSPLWTTLVEARMEHRRVSRDTIAGMSVSLAGIVLIIAASKDGVDIGGTALYGNVLCLVLAMLSGYVTNLQRRYLLRYHPFQVTMVITAVGTIGLTLLALPEALYLDWRTVHHPFIAVAIGSGLLSVAVAGILWSYGIDRLGAGKAANYNNLVPVAVFVASYFILGEEVTTWQCIGAAVTIGGVWYVRRTE
jgi:drug/metabolite transporter (DMT)-like permease